jgi:hypothetical protein
MLIDCFGHDSQISVAFIWQRRLFSVLCSFQSTHIFISKTTAFNPPISGKAIATPGATIVSLEEQMYGRLNRIRRAKSTENLTLAVVHFDKGQRKIEKK